MRSMSRTPRIGSCCCVKSHGAATVVLSAGAVYRAAGASIETRVNARWRLLVGAPQSHPVPQRVDPQMVWDIRGGRRVDAAHSTTQATVDVIGIRAFHLRRWPSRSPA